MTLELYLQLSQTALMQLWETHTEKKYLTNKLPYVLFDLDENYETNHGNDFTIRINKYLVFGEDSVNNEMHI